MSGFRSGLRPVPPRGGGKVATAPLLEKATAMSSGFSPSTGTTGSTPGFGLIRLFAVAGALAIGTFSLVMALVLGRFIESRMLQRDAQVGRDFVQSLAKIQQVAAVLRRGGSPQPAPGADPRFAEFIEHLAAIPSVLRVNVYSAESTVLWSSRPEMIGRRFEHNDELEEALRGEVVAHAAAGPGQPDKAEHMLMGLRPSEYIENYVPVVDEGGKKVVAVVELYRRPDDLFAAIHSGQKLVMVGAAAGGVFIFLSLIGFVRHTERRLREQQKRLIEADALAIVGEISAAVAHSIRNPLGSIRSSAELQRELGGDPDGTQIEIMRNVDRVEGLVRSMLAYAADGHENASRADLDHIVNDVAGRFAPDLGKQGKRFELDLQGGLGRVNADPVLLAQILQSLLTNAAEATAEGGRVKLRTAREGANAILEVSDNGVGIDPARLSNVFKPFFTTKARGLGMGLALAHRVAKRLGGDIDITSEPNQGTQVRMRLPVRSH